MAGRFFNLVRYAMGLVYVEENKDPERELFLLEEALLRMYVAEK